MERPRIKIKLTMIDYVVEFFSLAAVLSSIILFIIYWIKAPDIVPIHYNIHGEADGYGSKMTLIIEPILSVLAYVGLTVLNKYPHIFNFSTTVTEQNALSLYKTSTRMIRWFKLLICLFFAYMVWHEVNIIITQQDPKLDNLFWIFIVGIAVFPIFPIVKMIKKSKIK